MSHVYTATQHNKQPKQQRMTSNTSAYLAYLSIHVYHSCTGFIIISTTYVSPNHRTTSSRMFETCSYLFAAVEMMKCRSLKLLLDHPMNHVLSARASRRRRLRILRFEVQYATPPEEMWRHLHTLMYGFYYYVSCTVFTIISTTYVSENHTTKQRALSCAV